MRLGTSVAVAATILAIWAMTGGAAAPPSGPAHLLGSVEWREPGDGFGGFSAIELDPAGRSFVALSDRGQVFTGQLERTAGALVGVGAERSFGLPDDKGNTPGRFWTDTEGLARRADGRMFVSFEGFARIWHYGPDWGKARWVRQLPNWRDLSPNGSLEALAFDPQGRLLVLPEEIPDGRRDHPVYRLANDAWEEPFRLPDRGRYLPVGADFGPDGWLYILEREFTRLQFRSRVRRFLIADDSVVAEEPVFESGLGQHDNLEGLSVWRDSGGAIRLTMISDDNFKFFQRTEIVEYILP